MLPFYNPSYSERRQLEREARESALLELFNVDALECWLCPENDSEDVAVPKPVVQLTIDGKEIGQWPSITAAADALGINSNMIGKVVRGERNTTHGYKFKFLEAA